VTVNRAANYTIQGFLYQFHLTILEIVNSSNDATTTVEGIIEDIEVRNPSSTTAVQCKYHESKTKFVPSAVFEPLLQMMHHFHTTSGSNASYVLHAYFADPSVSASTIGASTMTDALASSSRELKVYTDALRNKIDLDAFLAKFIFRPGPQYDALAQKVQEALGMAGFSESDVATLVYPNSLHLVGNLARRSDLSLRSITRNEFIRQLRSIQRTAVSCWTLAGRSRAQVLGARKRQLASLLKPNERSRAFVISAEGIDNFEVEAAQFVIDYCSKYHFKKTHTRTPVFVLKASDDAVSRIFQRAKAFKVLPMDGYEAGSFDENRFLREPVGPHLAPPRDREFAFKILRWSHVGTIAKMYTEDIYLIGDPCPEVGETDELRLQRLATRSIGDIRFMMGIDNEHD
jgi:hypothetical protein